MRTMEMSLLGPRPMQETDGTFSVTVRFCAKLIQNHILGFSSRRPIPLMARRYPLQVHFPRAAFIIGQLYMYPCTANRLTYRTCCNCLRIERTVRLGLLPRESAPSSFRLSSTAASQAALWLQTAGT